MRGFRYDPLDRTIDSLRLLVLLPERARGQTDESNLIKCNLVHQTFASKPAYEALSYTWGNELPSKKIRVNNQEILVRENLYKALQAIRLEDTVRAVWVDALCINQSDTQERNSQVSLMAFIYTRAQRVLVWLGTTPWVGETLTLQRDKPPRIHGSSGSHYFTEEKVILGIGNTQVIARHPYWKRLWIIQEIILAREVVFRLGSHHYSWEEITNIYNLAVSAEVVKVAKPIMEQRSKRHTNALFLENIMETFKEAQCSELRDKIFGFLGIAHDCTDDMIEIDYEIGFLDLYIKVLKFQQSRAPFKKSEFKTEVDRSARLIKFSQLVQEVLGGMVDRDAKIAGPNKMPEWCYTAKGVIAGEIEYIGHTHDEMAASFDANKKWKQAIEKHYCDDEPALVELRRNDTAYSRVTLDWDETYLKKIRAVNSEFSSGYRYHGSRSQDGFVAKSSGRKPNDIDTTLAETTQWSMPRKFLGTSRIIGYIPPQARVGDLLCRFWGCNVVVILRESPSIYDQWKIVGRADISMMGREELDMERVINASAAETRLAPLEPGVLMNVILDIDTLQKLTI